MAGVKILSIDGGGIRGIIPAVWLDRWEQQSGVSVASAFELIGGTSTGALIAICAALGMPMSQVVRFYEQRGAAIFTRREFPQTHDCLIHSKYGHEAVESVLQELLGAAKLSDARCPLLVPCVDLDTREAHFWKSDRAKKDASFDAPMWFVGRCSTAAELYFDPSANRYTDGGTCANNPAMCLVAEALASGAALDAISVLSLGTGETREQPIRPINHGATGWLPFIADVFMDPTTSLVSFQCAQILRERYTRQQWQLGAISPAMDDASPAHIAALKAVALASISTQPQGAHQ